MSGLSGRCGSHVVLVRVWLGALTLLVSVACGIAATSQEAVNSWQDERSSYVGRNPWNRQRRQVATLATPSPLQQYTTVPYYDPSVDRLTLSESRLIKNVLIPAATNFLSRAIRLNLTSPITLTRNCNGTYTVVDKQLHCDSDCANATRCGPVNVPAGHLKGCRSCNSCSGTSPLTACCKQTGTDAQGVAAHLLLYVSAIDTPNCKNASVTLESSHCEQEPTLDRPVAGYLNFCPQNVSSLVNGDYGASVNKVLHYLIRILAFNFNLFGYFRSPSGTPMTHRSGNGLPFFSGRYIVSDLTVAIYNPFWPVASGMNINHIVHQLITPTVKREVQAHFGCMQLGGAELELQATDPSHGEYSLLEERLFHLDIMASGQNFHSAVVSRITLAVLQDSGWYNVDMSLGQDLHWGKGLGCNFVVQNCLGWINAERRLKRLPLPFCTGLSGSAPLTCSDSHHALARCNLQVYPQPVPPDYRYFANFTGVRRPDHLGGRNYLADYCPMIEDFAQAGQVSRCDNSDSATVFSERVQHFGSGSHCAVHENVWTRTDTSTGSKTMLSNFTAGCYRFSCQRQRLTLSVGESNYMCAYDGEWIPISVQVGKYSYGGTLVCPKAADICKGYGCPDDCSNNGACNSTTKQCQCKPGFFGQNCSSSFIEMWQDCASSPCQMDGTCVSSQSGYTCSCVAGFTGSRCDVNVDDCASQPCLKGTCLDGVNSFQCACNPGHTGTLCQTDISFCKSSPCTNNGTCTETVRNGATAGIACRCAASFRGDFCEILVPDACKTFPCHMGSCVPTSTTLGVGCACNPGFTGIFCGTPIDYCKLQPCLNSATCTNSQLNRTCTCTSNYYGDSCENLIIPCQPAMCKNSGTCSESPIGGVCTCPVSHTGRYCDRQLYCFSQPCLHNSTCSETPGVGFNCSCTAGYTGPLCGVNFDECSSSPCQNGGQCVDDINLFRCRCAPGFTGRRCEVQINECESLPCIHGQCIDRINGYLCNCTAGYTGRLCATEVDECRSLPCQHGGSCQDRVNAFRCTCLAGYTGAMCGVDIPECASNPCSSPGTAQCVDGVNSYRCVCNAGYMDSRCSTDIDECASSPCGNGSCVDLVDSFVCSCRPGFTGVRCDGDLNECASMPCQNGGSCVDSINAFSCQCGIRWTGSMCRVAVDPCSGVQCMNGGSCVVDASAFSASCQCTAGYTGGRCQHAVVVQTSAATTASPTTTSAPVTTSQAVPACVQSACRNGGSCDQVSGLCACVSGFAGMRCEITVPGCQVLVCQNGGTCTSHDQGRTAACSCAMGFAGIHCQLSPCMSQPCGASAECRALSADTYECLCPAGAYGKTCSDSTSVNHCLSSPCRNGGSCTNFGSQFVCRCLPGYTGHICESNIDECLSSPCENNGICEDGVNRFACLCPNGVTGSQCETLYNACLSNPCHNGGQCVAVNGRYACQCSAKYMGVQCQSSLSHSCEAMACANGATCVQHSNGTVSCDCAYGFGGLQCDVAIHACSSSPCLFGGQCIGSSQAPDWFLCNCSEGYRGDRCQIPEVCYPNPCQNGGDCGPSDKSEFNVTCRCPLGYAGEFCQSVNDPCSSGPCALGSICSRTVSGGYRCACAFPTAGKNCRASTDAAMYTGGSMSIVRLETAVKQLSFDVSVTALPYTGEGLLLAVFWGDDQTGDFLAIGLVSGVINVRYQLGGRSGLATASKALVADSWQVMRVTILSQMLWLTSNDTTDTRSLPTLADLSTSVVYVGGATEKILQRVQFATGFYGCLLSGVTLASGAPRAVELSDSARATHFSVQSCQQSSCARLGHSCANSGQCLQRHGQYVCSCPTGFGGLDCKQALAFWRPQFQGMSHLSLKPTTSFSGRQSHVELVFRPQLADCTLLLAMQKNDGVGDFLSISMHNGFAQFRFDCGGSPVVIQSNVNLTLHQWHNITAWRQGTRGWMAVDGGSPVSGESEGPLQQLDLSYGLYLGSHPSDVLPPIVAMPTSVSVPLQGCIASLAINRAYMDIGSGSSELRGSSGIAECGTSSLCASSCQTSYRGRCREDVNGTAVCVCPLSAGGLTCAEPLIFTSPSFSGSSYLSLDAVQFISNDLQTDVDFQVRPTHGDGTLLALMQGSEALLATDYIWLWLAGGMLHSQMDVGSGAVRLPPLAVSLNAWHRIQIVRNRSSIILVVDNQMLRGLSPGPAVALSDATQLYLGGAPPSTVQPYGLGTATGLQGCIANVRISSVPLASLEMSAMEAEGVGDCTAAPPI